MHEAKDPKNDTQRKQSYVEDMEATIGIWQKFIQNNPGEANNATPPFLEKVLELWEFASAKELEWLISMLDVMYLQHARANEPVQVTLSFGPVAPSLAELAELADIPTVADLLKKKRHTRKTVD